LRRCVWGSHERQPDLSTLKITILSVPMIKIHLTEKGSHRSSIQYSVPLSVLLSSIGPKKVILHSLLKTEQKQLPAPSACKCVRGWLFPVDVSLGQSRNVVGLSFLL
jgi:hypothetical protein